MEDHPWVIVNRTCLKSPDITALSCRHTTCYTGLLIDLLHVIDTQYSNMDNCTILGIETFGKPTNAGRSLTKNDTADVVGRGEADLALVTPGNGNTTNYKKFQPDAAFYALSLGFPKGSEFPDGILDSRREKIMSTLLEKWFINNTKLWTKEKQITNLTPKYECLYI
ncbi:uncharacterized protein LOC118437147 isoform X2 [Folsomia candida]|nr:uncharacterized protein LOC118437147 isoform X2 [Folsomia candida]